MSGHSKWATTKHKKAIIDSRRAKNFAKLIKGIEVAARNGGADMDGNPTLYDAVTKAKKSSVPSDNIERAIKRGAGLESGGAAERMIQRRLHFLMWGRFAEDDKEEATCLCHVDRHKRITNNVCLFASWTRVLSVLLVPDEHQVNSDQSEEDSRQ